MKRSLYSIHRYHSKQCRIRNGLDQQCERITIRITQIDPEHAILQENKIIVPKNRVDGLEGLGRDAVYKIINNQLCVYNPENDLDDCYQFMREKSTSDLKNFFK